MNQPLKELPIHRISIIWDFDKTLTPQDSTDELIKLFVSKNDTENFWNNVKDISGVNSQHTIDSVSSSEAPVWMYLLSEMATKTKKLKLKVLNEQLFKGISDRIELYHGVPDFLNEIKNLPKQDIIYKKNNIEIHHFIITAGLKDLVFSILKHNQSETLITRFFGCRYKLVKDRNIPIYCMDKTAKTRSLFEISKGSFLDDAKYKVDDFLSHQEEWCHFENMIYIGDGDTDIPAFSLIKSRRGMSIALFDPDPDKFDEKEEKAKNIKKGKRIDFFTPADFQVSGELFNFIETRCKQIAQRYDALRIP